MFGCSKAAEESQARTARKENSPLSQQQACFGRETKLLRAVIREDMSMAMVDELITDITRSVQYLDSHFTINVNDVHKPEGKSLEVSSSAPVMLNPACEAGCCCMCTGAMHEVLCNCPNACMSGHDDSFLATRTGFELPRNRSN